jgi:hypothetical protein
VICATPSEEAAGKRVLAGFATGSPPRGVHDGTDVFTVCLTGKHVEPFQLEICTS